MNKQSVPCSCPLKWTESITGEKTTGLAELPAVGILVGMRFLELVLSRSGLRQPSRLNRLVSYTGEECPVTRGAGPE